MCSSQDAAQALGTEAGQAVAAAIPSVFGPDPCALFEGTACQLTKNAVMSLSSIQYDASNAAYIYYT